MKIPTKGRNRPMIQHALLRSVASRPSAHAARVNNVTFDDQIHEKNN